MVPGGIFIDEKTGAVLYTDKLKNMDAIDLIEACPYNIPRVQAETGYISKCTMCVDRVHNGLLPACVKTCPTGAMNFGDRDRMAALAQDRLEKAKDRFPKASLTGIEYLRVFYLMADVPGKYYLYADAKSSTGKYRSCLSLFLMDKNLLAHIDRLILERPVYRRFLSSFRDIAALMEAEAISELASTEEVLFYSQPARGRLAFFKSYACPLILMPPRMLLKKLLRNIDAVNGEGRERCTKFLEAFKKIRNGVQIS